MGGLMLVAGVSSTSDESSRSSGWGWPAISPMSALHSQHDMLQRASVWLRVVSSLDLCTCDFMPRCAQ